MSYRSHRAHLLKWPVKRLSDRTGLIRARRLLSEVLEARRLLSTYYPANFDDGVAGGTLREAVISANANSTFSNNNAGVGTGGGIFVSGSSVTFSATACTFSGNAGLNGGETLMNGGGAISIGANGDLRIAQCAFVSNSGAYGGAIYATNGVHIDESTFTDNTGWYGGAGLVNGANEVEAIFAQ